IQPCPLRPALPRIRAACATRRESAVRARSTRAPRRIAAPEGFVRTCVSWALLLWRERERRWPAADLSTSGRDTPLRIGRSTKLTTICVRRHDLPEERSSIFCASAVPGPGSLLDLPPPSRGSHIQGRTTVSPGLLHGL